jgi:hypothetical protein
MRRRAVGVVLVTLALPRFTAAGQAARAPAATIDWPAFLARQDLVWSRLPTRWGESIFIGNGLIGATIDVQNGALGWTVNRTDFVHDQSRYPIGRLVLKTVGTIEGGTARLDLWNAEATGTLETDRGVVKWRSFVARNPSVIVVTTVGSGGETALDVEWNSEEARPPRKLARKEALAPEDMHPPANVRRTNGGLLAVQSFIGGDAHAESIVRSGSGATKIFYLAVGQGKTDSAAITDATSATKTAVRLGRTALQTGHGAWWHAFYPASFVSFPDPRLEAYYWIQIYKLGSAMRPDGPILDLNGPWFHATPWPMIWWNLNIQLTYSPLFRANRLGLAESLFRNLDRHTPALIDNVPERLRGEAAAIGRSAGPDLVRPVDLSTAESDAAHEMGNLPWTMFYYWEHYRYQMDDHVLRDRVYPLLCRAIGNYLAYIERGDDGKYHLPKTHSPELATIPDANYDLSLLRWGLQTLIASAEHLRLDEPRLTRWRDVLTNLTPFPVDSNGLMVGRDRPWKESHRHYSHLLAIYPLGLITPDSAAGRALIERSLRTWERQPELFRGYSFTGGASMHAMLGQGDTALDRLNRYLDAPRYMEPNTFYAESGPVIETPLSAATSIQELFLQDWGGALRVFPAVPTAWQDASFDRLRANGAFLVSGLRRNSRTAWVRVESLAGEPCVLVVPDWQNAVVRRQSGSPPRVARTGRGTGSFTIALPKGAWVVLASDATSQLPNVTPVARPTGARNPWPWSRADSTQRQ